VWRTTKWCATVNLSMAHLFGMRHEASTLSSKMACRPFSHPHLAARRDLSPSRTLARRRRARLRSASLASTRRAAHAYGEAHPHPSPSVEEPPPSVSARTRGGGGGRRRPRHRHLPRPCRLPRARHLPRPRHQPRPHRLPRHRCPPALRLGERPPSPLPLFPASSLMALEVKQCTNVKLGSKGQGSTNSISLSYVLGLMAHLMFHLEVKQ
jgi:hypothetical protein